jgi:replicative DNA helicase
MTDLLDVEYVTVGALMLAPQQLDTVRTWLQPDDFARPLCGEIYEAMLDMHGRQERIDPVTVLVQLHRHGRVRSDGRPGPEILTMVQAVPTPTAAAFYGRLVLEDALFRRLEQVGTRLAQIGNDRRGRIEDALDHATAQQQTLSALRDRWAGAQPKTDTPTLQAVESSARQRPAAPDRQDRVRAL